MMKRFNISGRCYPEKHYMVNLDSRLKKIKELVDDGDYFIINRARQYGKTTTLMALTQYLKEEYAVIFMSFQEISESDFSDEYRFVSAFAARFIEVIYDKKIEGLDQTVLMDFEKAVMEKMYNITLSEMFRYMKKLCATASKCLVLIIDEVDSASNNRVFMDFLAQLRARYMDKEEIPTFQSVILAGVYDVKNLKMKIRPEEEHRYNSPWNIAAKFMVDMSFSVRDIEEMLVKYEQDYHTGMNIHEIAGLIYDYTSGYPYLVSYICKMLDDKGREDVAKENDGIVWTKAGIGEAVKILLKDTNTLFDDMVKKLDEDKELRNMLYTVLFNGKSIPYNPDNHAINIGTMLGFIREENGMVVVTNRIFETRLYNLFLSEEVVGNASYQASDKNQFVRDGLLDMDLILEKFARHYTEIYGNSDVSFLYYHLEKGYMLSFNFNKSKKTGIKNVMCNGKRIVEAVV